MMLSGSETLTSQFFGQFEISLADTRSLQQRVCQIRHRVYCQELDFEPHRIDGLETDEYDNHSLHILLRDRLTDVDIGCIRVVEPVHGGGGLPFEVSGLRYADRRLLDWKKLDSNQCCELSRLAVLENIRRSPINGMNISDTKNIEIAKNLKVFIPIALSYAGFAISLACNYKWMFMVGEPRLNRFLTRYGLNFQQISPLFDWHGQRALFVFTRDDLLAQMQKWKPEWYEFYNYIEQKVTDKKEEFAIALAS
jgi:N-acyl amino acid synthase of PEP-CTERM/exosortase system